MKVTRTLALAAAGVVAVNTWTAYQGLHHHHGHGSAALTASSAPAPQAAQTAVRWALRQVGCPYVYGGTGPCRSGFDCSGLVMEAYAAAGIHFAHRSQDQWATLRHIPASQRGPGDIEFIVGSDGTWSSPGHEVLLISRNKAVEAYATGDPVRVISLKNPPPGDENVVGFADPTMGARS